MVKSDDAKAPAQDARAQRLAKALRDNLRRRKAAAPPAAADSASRDSESAGGDSKESR